MGMGNFVHFCVELNISSSAKTSESNAEGHQARSVPKTLCKLQLVYFKLMSILHLFYHIMVKVEIVPDFHSVQSRSIES